MLDHDHLEEWLELLSDNIHYWAPVRADMNRSQEDLSPPLRLAFFDDNKDGLKLRVARIVAPGPRTPTSRPRACVI